MLEQLRFSNRSDFARRGALRQRDPRRRVDTYGVRMSFRTTVKDGLILVNTHGEIPDGTPVEISVGKSPAKAKPRPGQKKKSARRRQRTPAFGIWADRKELGSPEEAVDRLRALTRRRRVG